MIEFIECAQLNETSRVNRKGYNLIVIVFGIS